MPKMLAKLSAWFKKKRQQRRTKREQRRMKRKGGAIDRVAPTQEPQPEPEPEPELDLLDLPELDLSDESELDFLDIDIPRINGGSSSGSASVSRGNSRASSETINEPYRVLGPAPNARPPLENGTPAFRINHRLFGPEFLDTLRIVIGRPGWTIRKWHIEYKRDCVILTVELSLGRLDRGIIYPVVGLRHVNRDPPKKRHSWGSLNILDRSIFEDKYSVRKGEDGKKEEVEDLPDYAEVCDWVWDNSGVDLRRAASTDSFESSFSVIERPPYMEEDLWDYLSA